MSIPDPELHEEFVELFLEMSQERRVDAYLRALHILKEQGQEVVYIDNVIRVLLLVNAED